MSSDSTPPQSNAHLWIVAGIILLAVIIGGATLVYVLRTTPARSLPSPTSNVSGVTGVMETSPTLSPASIATPSPFPTLTTAPTAVPAVTPPATRLATATPPVVRAKIEIVWPHDGVSVREADLANITVYLISGNGISSGTGMEAPPCDWAPEVRLWRALNNLSAQQVAAGEKRMFSSGGRTYPVWDFNDVVVAEARDPANKLTFFVTVDGVTALTNVWAHASDARTIFPQADVPTDIVRQPPDAVDARIQIVWPHDNLPLAMS